MGRVDQAAHPVLARRLQAARQVDRVSAATGREAPRGVGCAAHGAPPRRGGGAASYERGVRPRQPIAGRPARPLPRLVPHASTLCRGGTGWREWAVDSAGLHAAPARPPRVGRARPAAVRGGRARRGAAAHARGAGCSARSHCWLQCSLTLRHPSTPCAPGTLANVPAALWTALARCARRRGVEAVAKPKPGPAVGRPTLKP
mmetsp:Transcript_18707/g.63075  ORF Transcript_18707/g.63075 Transcript_18707/m.63075 type:complete len:202 (-) Transcript_18707:30-635(-)